MSDARDMLDAGLTVGEPRLPQGGDIPYAVIPQGAELRDLEHLLPDPTRTRVHVTMADVPSFCGYFNTHRGTESVIFGDPTTFRLVGIIDYPEPGQPHWAEHRVIYAAPKSPEWLIWRSHSGKMMPQVEFATFIEDNLVDIQNPPGADVLELARGLKAKKEVEFVSTLDMVSGTTQFTYNETVQGSQARGQMVMPNDFNLGIPVLFNGERYAVVARVRYRIAEGKLKLWYDLYRPEYVERDAFNDLVDKVKDETGVAPWLGTD